MSWRASPIDSRICALEAENKSLRAERDSLRATNKTILDAQTGNVWFWQGDGENHLESLTCAVVIGAEELRELLSRPTKNEEPMPTAERMMCERCGVIQTEAQSTDCPGGARDAGHSWVPVQPRRPREESPPNGAQCRFCGHEERYHDNNGHCVNRPRFTPEPPTAAGKLKEDLLEVSHELSRVSTLYEGNKTYTKKVEFELRQLEAQNKWLTETSDKVAEERNELERQHSRLTETCNRVAGENAELERQKVRLSSDLNKLTAEKADLTKRLDSALALLCEPSHGDKPSGVSVELALAALQLRGYHVMLSVGDPGPSITEISKKMVEGMKP